jgi:dienelactone hydrolase
VIYNHGGMGDQIGGAPAETCEALAEAGFVGFSPMRRPTISLEGHLDDVLAGVDYVKGLGYVVPDRIAIMGFSRGGLLTYMAATKRSEDFRAIVIMASAVEILNGLLSEAGKISAPVLLLIAENDTARQDHVQAMQELDQALVSAGKQSELIIYPPYGQDGHRMFFEVGEYWKDVSRFLQENL